MRMEDLNRNPNGKSAAAEHAKPAVVAQHHYSKPIHDETFICLQAAQTRMEDFNKNPNGKSTAAKPAEPAKPAGSKSGAAFKFPSSAGFNLSGILSACDLMQWVESASHVHWISMTKQFSAN